MGFEVNNFIDKKMTGMHSLLEYVAVPLLVNEAKTNAYWKDRSSNARNQIDGGVEGGNGDFNLYLAHGAEYGGWLEEGTGVYGPTKKPIVPVDSKMLSWVDEDGKRHYAKMVKGMKPKPILGDTLNNNKQAIANRLIEYWSD